MVDHALNGILNIDKTTLIVYYRKQAQFPILNRFKFLGVHSKNEEGEQLQIPLCSFH